MKFNFETKLTEAEIAESLNAIAQTNYDFSFGNILKFNLSSSRTNLTWNNTLIQFWYRSITVDIKFKNLDGSIEVYLHAQPSEVAKTFAFLIVTMVFSGFISQFKEADFIYIIMKIPIGLLIVSPWVLAMWLVNRSEKRDAIRLILNQFVTPNN